MPEKVKEEDKTVQHILPNIQDKNNREVDKGMDSLKLTVSICLTAITSFPLLHDTHIGRIRRVGLRESKGFTTSSDGQPGQST